MNRRMMMGSAVLGASLITGKLFGDQPNRVRGIENLIFINLKGGPSQMELFDAKPMTYNSGPTKALKTKINGVYFNRTMTGLANFSDNMAVFRMSSPERDHKRGQYYLQSGGNRPLSNLKHPGLCSIVGWAKGMDPDLPGAVTIGGFQGSGYLGAKHSPFGIENLDKTRELMSSVNVSRVVRASNVKEKFHELSPYKNHQTMKDGAVLSKRALQLSLNPKFREAIGEQSQVRNYCPDMGPSRTVSIDSSDDDFSYNEDNSESFIASCGVAVEMVKLGVPAIQIELSGWDSHENNFEIHNTLTDTLDRGMLQVINGLKQAGKFENSLIYISGEFGRTPKISAKEGREDYSDIFCSAIISGAISKGMAFGETDFSGQKITNAVSVSQLTGSILKTMGVDPLKKVYKDHSLVPVKRDFLAFT